MASTPTRAGRSAAGTETSSAGDPRARVASTTSLGQALTLDGGAAPTRVALTRFVLVPPAHSRSSVGGLRSASSEPFELQARTQKAAVSASVARQPGCR
jgi:hypothetical protein